MLEKSFSVVIFTLQGFPSFDIKDLTSELISSKTGLCDLGLDSHKTCQQKRIVCKFISVIVRQDFAVP